MANDFLYDVFLSHNQKDKPRVRRLAERLRDAGLRVWYDDWNVKAGEIISLKVDEGLDQSRVLVLCMSPNALKSGWVALERSTGIHRDPSNENRRFIPLLLADCNLPDTLRRYKYLDFRDESDSVFAELLAACRVEQAEPPRAAQPARKRAPAKKRTKSPKQPHHQAELAVLECKLEGHKSGVTSLAVSADGKWIASGSQDHSVKIWDLEQRKCRKTITTKSPVWAVTIAKDNRLAWILETGTLEVFNVQDDVIQLSLSAHPSFGRSLSCSPNGDICVSSSANTEQAVKVWEMPSGKLLRTLTGQTELGWSVATDVGGTLAIAGGYSGELKVWDLETGTCTKSLSGHGGIVRSVCFSPDRRFAASAASDSTIKIWDLEAGGCIGTLEGHGDFLYAVRFSNDGTLLASAGFTDDTIRLWDWKSGECLQIIHNEEAPCSLAFTADDLHLIVGTAFQSIYIYRLPTGPTATAATTRRYVNAKIVLVGEGTVGKTSLAHRLINDEYVVTDRTHGMNVWPLDLPLETDTAFEREALLWDLAGQEDYRLVHQLFLNETALALLLINPQKDDPFAEAGDWLKALKAACGNSETGCEADRLLIFSQVDVGGMKLGNAKIERFCEQYGFSGWLPTSAKSGENCSDVANKGKPSKLKQLIASTIFWEKLPWTSTPRLLSELKKAVVTMRDERDIRLLRFAELVQRLEQALPDEKFDESNVRTAVTLLANHGLARSLKFGDLVLLQPELLNGYGGAIIRAARANKDEIGSVLEAAVYAPDFDFTGVDRLKHRPDEELLLRALVQTFLNHSLCIAEDLANGRHLVFPSQYRREKDIPRDPDIFVSYTFSGEWQTVWTTLVVRLWYSQQFKHKELWRNAVEFESPTGFTLGLKIDNQQGAGTATVSAYFDKEVPDDLKAIFIEYVHRHLARFGCEVSRDRRYLCQQCGTPVKDLEAVRKRLEAKKAFIACQICDEKVILIDFIEQQLKSDPVARKILAMDELATRALDAQALEQILIGHMMATCGEANQIFRELKSDYGIDGEVEFKDNDGRPSGKKIYVQLKSDNVYRRTRQSDGSEAFEMKDKRHLEHWITQAFDVYLVVRQTDEITGTQTIRWMNVTRYLNDRLAKASSQIPFNGEKLDMEAVWKVRDQFFPKPQQRK